MKKYIPILLVLICITGCATHKKFSVKMKGESIKKSLATIECKNCEVELLREFKNE